MADKAMNFEFCDQVVKTFEDVVKHPVKGGAAEYYTGVDLGTACVVVAVMNEKGEPVAGKYQYADIVRDGMIVDYIGAVEIVRRMKQELEEILDTELIYAAAAIPPGTETLDGGAVSNVVEAAGFEIVKMMDESTAANELLGLKNGAVVDVGGGTTGISILKDGEVTYVADEPTGGTHVSLVLAGAYKIPFDEAELRKRDPKNHKEVLHVVKPTIQKVASIISKHIEGQEVDHVVLAGGTCCLTGIENIVEKEIGVPTFKPENPMFVTPLGIALGCVNAMKK